MNTTTGTRTASDLTDAELTARTIRLRNARKILPTLEAAAAAGRAYAKTPLEITRNEIRALERLLAQ